MLSRHFSWSTPRVGVSLAGATGITAKVQRLKSAGFLPTKIQSVGEHLGHVRNGADHGADPEVQAPWTIRPATGVEYTFLACSFVTSCLLIEAGTAYEL